MENMVYIVGFTITLIGFIAALIIQYKKIAELETEILNLRIKINKRSR